MRTSIDCHTSEGEVKWTARIDSGVTSHWAIIEFQQGGKFSEIVVFKESAQETEQVLRDLRRAIDTALCENDNHSVSSNCSTVRSQHGQD